MPTELILIRHGHAVRVNGHYYNAPLTALGQTQAAMTGRYFCSSGEHLDGFYCSPLRRARETAGRIGIEVRQQPHIRQGIQEIERFEVPQLVFFEFLARLGFFGRYLYDNSGKPLHWPIVGRVSSALTPIIEKHPDQRVAVVMHAGVINAVLAWYFPGRRRRLYLHNMDNCSLTRVMVDGGAPKLVAYDDTSHLRPEVKTVQPPAQPAAQVQAAEKTIAPPTTAPPAPTQKQ
ncbi:MAG: histidine phosphatase family protein [Rudaea sp.]